MNHDVVVRKCFFLSLRLRLRSGHTAVWSWSDASHTQGSSVSAQARLGNALG